MRTHIFTALLALILTACASHHRDVASVENETELTQAEQARAEQASAKGDRGIR